jgi:hypothetical protein
MDKATIARVSAEMATEVAFLSTQLDFRRTNFLMKATIILLTTALRRIPIIVVDCLQG